MMGLSLGWDGEWVEMHWVLVLGCQCREDDASGLNYDYYLDEERIYLNAMLCVGLRGPYKTAKIKPIDCQCPCMESSVEDEDSLIVGESVLCFCVPRPLLCT